MKITTLVENDAAPGQDGLTPEFGLSLHIEHQGRRILFDTGATGVAMRNARRLGIDPARVDAVVLSHHHFDHGGGLPAFFELNTQAKVYLRPPPDGQPCFRAMLVVNRDVGLAPGLLEHHRHRFEFVERFSEILPGAFVLTDIPHHHPLPAGDRYLYLKQDGGYVHDPFAHELVLVLREPDGAVAFTGCGHSGVLNMVDGVAERFPGLRLKAVVGGFHLIGLPVGEHMAGTPAEMTALARAMQAQPVDAWWTGHCTGHKAYGVLKQVLGERLNPFNTGTTLAL